MAYRKELLLILSWDLWDISACLASELVRFMAYIAVHCTKIIVLVHDDVRIVLDGTKLRLVWITSQEITKFLWPVQWQSVNIPLFG